ncbi:MAG: RNA-metabolising metallo-beta-lactamase [Candidatus Peregrinibacteria bacterium Greene0416_19]|nr:MAG: RNA-metabolising metallo-beta-lactamase [Candidatus Peregrinibacteria bacterium Greene0416_19]
MGGYGRQARGCVPFYQMPIKIIPHGAAQEVTGTCHEIQVWKSGASKPRCRFLLDCGLFQGQRTEAAIKNASFNFQTADIDAVVLSHAHMDHVGRIPLLYKRGYRGPVFCTYATKDLSEVMLKDSGYIQEKDEEFFCKHLSKSMLKCDGPLYTQKDAEVCMRLFQGVNYLDWFTVCPGVRAQFLDAGHIIGAAMVVLEIEDEPASSTGLRGSGGRTRRVGFSGDLGRPLLPIIRDPSSMPPVETLICESTYGNRKHEDVAIAKIHLKEVIERTAKRGGKLIIPAFSLERTQEIVYDLHLLWDAREIPAVPIIIDSPLASRVTDIFMKHPECYDRTMFEDFLSRAHNPFQFSLVRYTESVEESKALNGTPGPMVIMAASGMCEAGRVRHHLKNEIENERNTILAVGYMAENTLGRRIVDKTVYEVRIFDEMYRKKAEIVSLDAYSGHADMIDLDSYVTRVEGLRTLILVHGEPHQMEPFAKRMSEKMRVEVTMPMREEEIVL